MLPFMKHFSPFPKNPNIARVFKETGMADELGSGVRNLLKYVQIYANGKPQLFDEDVFKLIVPISDFSFGPNEPINEPINLTLEQERLLLEIKKDPKITKPQLEETLGKSRASITRYIAELRKMGLLEREGSNKTGRWVIIKNK